MAWATVFVDDAVCGRFPPVCAEAGLPSDGRLAVSELARAVRARQSRSDQPYPAP